jgi:GT2 family glycosyltransferase
MTDAPAPPSSEEPTTDDRKAAPRVNVIVAAIAGADLSAAIASVERQSYEAVGQLMVVGAGSEDLPEGVEQAEGLETAINQCPSEVEYLWLIHSDARPRPDALSALVSELQRNGASLGGSKLLIAGSMDELESIGSATDIFGEPFSGLDEGEIDLEQYDVVREVAYVSSVSMLVRRDLAQGLNGLDDKLPPGAAGLDLSQRVRLAGGRVITVPSSEVYHQGRCGARERGWREQAGRTRAMLKAYSLLTLLWVVPYSLLVAMADSLANLLFLRWRPLARHVAAWAWNLIHAPSTIGARRRFRPVRSTGDEELFRFQSRGSVHLREVGSELSDRILSVFDDDRALAKGSKRVWGSPGIWGAILAAAIAVFAARSIFFSGVPNTGFSFPFEPPSVSLDRFFGGWNDSGLGSPSAVHPVAGLSGIASFIWFGAEGAARTLLTLLFALLAVVGMGRLAGRLGFRGPGRYLSGLVLLAGPGTAVLAGYGSWTALGAAALLPWAARGVFLHSADIVRSRWVQLGLVIFWSTLLGAISPLLVVVPLFSGVVWYLVGGRRGNWLLTLSSLLGVLVALSFVLTDPGWVLDDSRRLGLSVENWWPALIGVTALPMVFMEGRVRRLGMLGAILGLGAIVVVLSGAGGPGVEEAALVLSSFGAAVVVAAALDVLSGSPIRIFAGLAGIAALVLSVGLLADGRLGLPAGDQNERFGFAEALAEESGPGRILLVSTERELVSGEARPGPGFWYRALDGSGTTIAEGWLPEMMDGDGALDAAVRQIATGSELRPGELLAPFAIDWFVIDGPESPLDEPLLSQLDLVPTPLATGARVFDIPAAVPRAFGDSDLVWATSGAGYEGRASGTQRLRLAENFASGWGPDAGPLDWATTVSAADGSASYRAQGVLLLLPIVAGLVFLLGIGLVVGGRLRR